MASKIKIPIKTIKLMKSSVLGDYQGVNKDPEFGAINQFNVQRVNERYNNLIKELKLKEIKKQKILEIGSGSGLFIAYLRKKGIEAYGIEPDKKSYDASKILLRENKLNFNIKNSDGEKIPFKKEFFDVVISFQVIEHTKNPFLVLKESKRVLKKGGHIYFVVPNYHSFWEGHYRIIWFPFFNKFFAKIYVRILGRNASFIDTLQFITPKKIKLWTKELNLKVINLGEENFRKNLCEEKIKEYWSGNKFLGNIIKFIRKFCLDKFMSWLFIKFDFYYPLILVAKKDKT